MCGQDPKSSALEVKPSGIQGYGVFATRNHRPGQKIGDFEGYLVNHDDTYTLTVSGYKIMGTGPLKYLNHSCDPNAYFRDRTLFAKKHISRGEELTIDYQATEGSLSSHFACHCGSPNCRKLI